jgi:hypothetical protein
MCSNAAEKPIRASLYLFLLNYHYQPFGHNPTGEGLHELKGPIGRAGTMLRVATPRTR